MRLFLNCLGSRGKEILKQLSKPRFLRSLKIELFPYLLCSSGEKPAILELRKNVALRFVLIQYLFQSKQSPSTNVLPLFDRPMKVEKVKEFAFLSKRDSVFPGLTNNSPSRNFFAQELLVLHDFINKIAHTHFGANTTLHFAFSQKIILLCSRATKNWMFLARPYVKI